MSYGAALSPHTSLIVSPNHKNANPGQKQMFRHPLALVFTRPDTADVPISSTFTCVSATALYTLPRQATNKTSDVEEAFLKNDVFHGNDKAQMLHALSTSLTSMDRGLISDSDASHAQFLG